MGPNWTTLLLLQLSISTLNCSKSKSNKSDESTVATKGEERPSDKPETIPGYLLPSGEIVYQHDLGSITIAGDSALAGSDLSVKIETLRDFKAPGDTLLLGHGMELAIDTLDQTTPDADKFFKVTLSVTDTGVNQSLLNVISKDARSGQLEVVPNLALTIIEGEQGALKITFLTKKTHASFAVLEIPENWISPEDVTLLKVAKDPSSFVVANSGTNEIQLLWSSDQPNVSFLLNYNLGLSSPKDCYTGAVTGSFETENLSAAITDLENGAIYSFRLCAKLNDSPPSRGITVSVATKGLSGYQAPFRFQFQNGNQLPAVAKAGANIVIEHPLYFALLNQDGVIVPGDSSDTAHLVPFADMECQNPVHGARRGYWSRPLKDGEGFFFNVAYEKAEPIYLALCDSSDCESGKLPIQKTCLGQMLTIEADEASLIELDELPKITATQPFALAAKLVDTYGNLVSTASELVTVKACAEEGTDVCQSTGIALQGNITKTAINGALKYDLSDNLVYSTADTIKLFLASKNLALLSDSIAVEKAPAPNFPTAQHSLLIPDFNLADDYFGAKLALWQNTLVAVAPWHSYNEFDTDYVRNAGALYIFERTGLTWAESQKLVAQGTNARIRDNYMAMPYSSNNMGAATTCMNTIGMTGGGMEYNPKGIRHGIAIKDETIAVGHPCHDYDEDGLNEKEDAGAAFIYRKSNGVWSQSQILIAEGTNARVSGAPGVPDLFGGAVAIDGDFVVIGAADHSYDAVGQNIKWSAGAVFVYKREGDSYQIHQKLVAESANNGRMAGDNFGWDVAIKGDYIIVGAVGHDYDDKGLELKPEAGAVFVYKKDVAGYFQSYQKIIPTGDNARKSADYFGGHLAFDGATLAVGAPENDYDEEGQSFDDIAGAVFIYILGESGFTQQAKIVSSDRVNTVRFGLSLDIQGDTLAVSAPGTKSTDGRVYLFTRANGVWAQSQELPSSIGYFGLAVALEGDQILLSSPLADALSGEVQFWK